MFSITNLATATPLTAVKNEIPDVSDLAQKADYHAEIIKIIKNEYFTTSDIIGSRIIYLMQIYQQKN